MLIYILSRHWNDIWNIQPWIKCNKTIITSLIYSLRYYFYFFFKYESQFISAFYTMERKCDKSLRYREEEKHLSFYMASVGKHKKENKSIYTN